MDHDRPLPRLLAGAARADTTPDDLTGVDPFGGGFTAVHSRLHVRAVVLDGGEGRCAVVAADLIEVGDTTWLRRRVEREVGVPADRVLVVPSHSHNAPRTHRVLPGAKARVPGPRAAELTAAFDDAVVAVLAEAVSRMRPVSLGLGRADVDVNVCREAYVDGRWTLGTTPQGPSGKELAVLALRDDGGRTVAALLNYAVHSTVALGVPELSSDLAGAAAEHVERELGGDAVALWLPGAIGDQAPRFGLNGFTGDDPARDRRFAHEAIAAQGFLAGAGALRALDGIDLWTPRAAVRGAARTVAVPARRLPVPEGMEQAEVDTVAMGFGALLVGDTALLGVPGEITTPVHRALLGRIPLRSAMVLSNANSRIGYLPTDESYDRHTQAADGCPVARGHAAATVTATLRELVLGLLGLPG